MTKQNRLIQSKKVHHLTLTQNQCYSDYSGFLKGCLDRRTVNSHYIYIYISLLDEDGRQSALIRRLAVIIPVAC